MVTNYAPYRDPRREVIGYILEAIMVFAAVLMFLPKWFEGPGTPRFPDCGTNGFLIARRFGIFFFWDQ